MDTSGFYKLDGVTLLYAKEEIASADLRLTRSEHETHNYPVDGWTWFDSEKEARIFYNLPEKELI